MQHTHQSPYPRMLADKAIIVDELCLCGALRSEHGDTEHDYGHGTCPARSLGKIFTWDAFVWQDVSASSSDKLTIPKLAHLRAIEACMGERIPRDAWAGLVAMCERELAATARWLERAKKKYEEAASDAAIRAASVAQ